MTYATPDGLTEGELEKELLKAFDAYTEGLEPGRVSARFDDMVARFAADKHCALHRVTRAYLDLNHGA